MSISTTLPAYHPDGGRNGMTTKQFEEISKLGVLIGGCWMVGDVKVISAEGPAPASQMPGAYD